MPGTIRNTVDRLDKPSAYYQGRVSSLSLPAGGGKLGSVDKDFTSRTRSADTMTGKAMKEGSEPQKNQLRTH